MRRFFEEVIRRKVLPVAAAYAIGGWVLLQVGDVMIGLLELPGWTGRVLVALTVLGLPVALIIAWIYDWTPKGLVATRDQEKSVGGGFRFGEPQPIELSELTLPRARLGQLIGRHRERDTLGECLEAAKAGTGGMVLIGGEPGVGKSRLGEEALALGRERGLLPLTGHAYEDRGAPFITSVEILEEVVQVLPEDALRNALGHAAPEIARLLPELRHLLPDIPEPVELPPEQQQRYLFNAVLDFLKRLTRGTPVVMLFDDLHWADESSIALLEHLAPHVPTMPILMVATFRDVESDMGEPFRRALAGLSREPYVTRIDLGRFSRDDVDSLLKALSAHEPPDNVVEAVFEETNGNAFFVQSVYQHLADEGRLFDQRGDWRQDIDPASLDVPDSVRLVTGRRIARLTRDTQQMLNVAAVMGLRFAVPVLEAAMARDVLDGIEEAEAAHLIKRSPGGRMPRYEFVHALARHTVLDALSSLRRQKTHLGIAAAIESVHAGAVEARAADLAFHLVEAGGYADEDRTVRWLRVAGENAMAAAAMEEAAGYYDTVLAMTEEAPSGLRADVYQRRAVARMGLGDAEGGISDLRAAIAVYQSLGENRQAAMLITRVSIVLVYSGRPAEALEAVARGESLIGDAESPEKSRLLAARGMACSMGADLGAAARHQAAAVAMARKFDDPRLLADVSQMQAICFHWQMYGDLGARSAHEVAAMRRALNQDWDLAQCLWMEKFGLAFAGRFDEAASLGDELDPLARRQGNFLALAISSWMSALVEQSRGDLDASSELTRQSNEFFDAAGTPWAQPFHSINLLLQGRDDEARALVEEFRPERARATAWAGSIEGYWLCCKAWLGDDDILERYREYRHYLPQAGKAMAGGAVVFTKGAIEALILTGEDDEAGRLYPIIADFVSRDLGVFGFTHGLHERFAGMAAAAAKEWDSAERHFRHSLHVVDDEYPHRVDQARVRYWFARMLIDRNGPGDRERAGELLSEARSLGEAMGMAGLIRRISEL